MHVKNKQNKGFRNQQQINLKNVKEQGQGIWQLGSPDRNFNQDFTHFIFHIYDLSCGTNFASYEDLFDKDIK